MKQSEILGVVAACYLAGTASCYTGTSNSQANYGGSSASVSPANLVGTGTSTITVALQTGDDAPIVGSIVQVNVDGCDVTQPTSPTKTNGTTSASVLSCSKPGQHAVSVEVTSGARQVNVPVTAALKSVMPATLGGHDVQAGFPLNTQVVVAGPDDAPDADFTGIVHFTSSDTAAILPADYTFNGSENGVKGWVDAVTFRTAGTQTLTAVATASGKQVLNETYIVTPGPAGALVISQKPDGVNAGATFQVTVTATDSTGATLAGYTGSVGFVSSDAAAVLPAPVPFLPGDAGQKTFTLALKTAGMQTLQATDGNIASVPQSIPVTAGGPAKLRLIAPVQFVAGVTQPVTVQSTDAFGNVVPTYSGTVHFSSSDPNINLTSTDPNVRSLPPDTPFAGAGMGTMIFPKVSLVTAGLQSITVTDAQDSNYAFTQTGIKVVGASAVNWTVAANNLPWVAGSPTTVTVTALDIYNNPASLYRGIIKFSSTDPNATLPANYTFNANDLGVKVYTQGVTWMHSGPQTLTVTDFIAHRGGTMSATVAANAVTGFSLSAYDNPAYVAKDGNVTVSAVDSWGNVNPNFIGTVHFTSTDPNAVLPADAALQSSNQGVITTGTVRFGNYGPQQLVATSTQSAQLTGNANIAVHQINTLISNDSTSTCAIVDNGRLRCWGQNADGVNDCPTCAGGALGLGDTTDRGYMTGSMGANLPYVDLGTGRTVKDIVGGIVHRCALLDDNTVKCWGDNTYAELGLGDAASRGRTPNTMGDNLPTVFLGTGRTAKKIWAGRSATCVKADDNNVRCWGYNADGELGLGDPNNRGDTAASMQNLPPVNVGTGRTIMSMALGSYHTCAILDDATVKCWGYNHEGELGLGDNISRGANPGDMGDNLPTVDLGTGRTATVVGAGRNHTCALLDNHQVKCWGFGNDAAIGSEATAIRGDMPNQMGDNLPPVSLGTGRTVNTLVTGMVHNCVVLDDSTIKCWGQNSDGRLGVGDARYYGNSPGSMGDGLPVVRTPTGRVVLQLMAGAYHTCIRTDNGLAYCWGDNQQGQMGLANGLTGSIGISPSDMGDGLQPAKLW